VFITQITKFKEDTPETEIEDENLVNVHQDLNNDHQDSKNINISTLEAKSKNTENGTPL